MTSSLDPMLSSSSSSVASHWSRNLQGNGNGPGRVHDTPLSRTQDSGIPVQLTPCLLKQFLGCLQKSFWLLWYMYLSAWVATRVSWCGQSLLLWAVFSHMSVRISLWQGAARGGKRSSHQGAITISLLLVANETNSYICALECHQWLLHCHSFSSVFISFECSPSFGTTDFLKT